MTGYRNKQPLTVTAQDLVVISADLEEAERLSHKTNNPQNVNLFGYFSEQAIEKALNALLQAEGTEEQHSHNVPNKLLDIGMTQPMFLKNHPYIMRNAKGLTQCNTLRYGQMHIDLSDAMDIYNAAKELYEELLTEYQRTQPDEEKMLADAKKGLSQTRQIKFRKDEFSRD